MSVVPQRHREVTHMTASITRLPGFKVTPEVKKDIECALIHPFLNSPISLLSLLLHLSLYLAAITVCLLYCKEMSLGEERGKRRRRKRQQEVAAES